MYDAYGATEIRERFRHRYHINLQYLTDEAKEKGMCVSALDETGQIVNALELTGDHWMVGTQFHPEFNSRPNRPSPIYFAFIKAVIAHKFGEETPSQYQKRNHFQKNNCYTFLNFPSLR